MTVEEKLRAYSERMKVVRVDEEKLEETIRISKSVWYQAERETLMSGLEFLLRQACYIRKRWWLAQALVLFVLWNSLFVNGAAAYQQRIMGIIAPVFVILLMPELWKSQNCGFMEIEAVSYFSIRRIYAARMLLFGMADILLLSVFFAASAFMLRVTIGEMVVQFCLPMLITCCICFHGLCSNRADSEYIAFGMSLLWMAVWLLVVLQERVYAMITVPVWVAMVLLSSGYFAYTVYKVWKSCGRYWEVNLSSE